MQAFLKKKFKKRKAVQLNEQLLVNRKEQ